MEAPTWPGRHQKAEHSACRHCHALGPSDGTRRCSPGCSEVRCRKACLLFGRRWRFWLGLAAIRRQALVLRSSCAANKCAVKPQSRHAMQNVCSELQRCTCSLGGGGGSGLAWLPSEGRRSPSPYQRRILGPASTKSSRSSAKPRTQTLDLTCCFCGCLRSLTCRPEGY